MEMEMPKTRKGGDQHSCSASNSANICIFDRALSTWVEYMDHHGSHKSPGNLGDW